MQVDSDLTASTGNIHAKANTDALADLYSLSDPAAMNWNLPVELERRLQPLTPRERQVLELAAREGLAYKQIARRLGIAKASVHSHMIAIYDKLSPRRRNRFLAAIEGWRRGEICLF